MRPPPRSRPSSFHLLLVASGVALASTGCGSTAADTPGGTAGGTTSDAGAEAAADAGAQADGGSAAGDASSADGGLDGVLAVPLAACVPLVYAADLTIGSQDFQLIVDTGSASLGVAGAGCSNCSVSPLYQPGSTATDEKQTASSQFGTGSFSGEIYQDDVSFPSGPKVPVKFVSIASQTGFFQAGSTCGGKVYQGIVGFDRPTAALSGTNVMFDQMVSVQKVPDVFATQLCDDGGTLWLGGFDPSATAGPVQYTPFTKDVASGYYYTVDLATVTVAGTTVPIPSGSYTDTIVDTGTSAFLLGSSAYTQLTQAIAASPGFQQVFGTNASTWFTPNSSGGVSCANLTQSKAELDSTLPPLTLTFGSNPGITVQAVATESYLMPYPGAGWCNALVSQAQSASFPVASIMGAPVLRSSVVVFDRNEGQVGFAPHKPCTTSARSTAIAAPLPVLQRIPRVRTN